jgi:hypothetical protein|tara:strand:- start:477 stop:758 length:282 start_codon:yes stop_codon:yes gene_type:complete
MPNNNDNFDLTTFVESQLRENNTSVEGVIQDDQLNYVAITSLLEKVIMESLLKYPNSAQSRDLMMKVDSIVTPIKEKLLSENNNLQDLNNSND